MNPKFKDLLAALAMAAAVAGAALGHAQAKAGPLDQGPHILIGQGHEGPLIAIAVYGDKNECLAARDDLYRQLDAYNKVRAHRAFLACIPGRNT